MIDSFELLDLPMAKAERLDDVQLGLLLEALQLGSGVTSEPEQLRRAIALLERADRDALCVC
jgi:hypothetical protein